MADADVTYRMAFASLRGMTPVMAREILARTGGEEAFFKASASQLSAMMGLSNRLFADDYRASVLVAAEVEAAFVRQSGITPVYFTDEGYPALLTECDDAPLMLYKLGRADLSGASPVLAVVGTRHATPYGIDFTEKLIADIAEKCAVPVTVVSGLAFGIDIAAHKAALRHGLPTVAVLAHGLNMIYPAQHRQAAADIVRSGGALLTEYGSGAPVHKGNFVARNRIVAGMSHCLVVVESASKGGALITARLASDYHRDVFALPGRVSDRYSAGCNRLISENVAALADSADRIIDAMGWPRAEVAPKQTELFVSLAPEEQAVVDFVAAHEGATLNVMSVQLGIGIGRLMALLIDMELRGLLLKYPGGKYRLASNA